MAIGDNKESLGHLYWSLRRIRRVEEVIADIYPSDKIKSPVHLAIGQEHVSVAVCDQLRRDDWVGGSYRSHAMYLAKGGDLNQLMAEMYGKSTGCCGGKGGSMHLIDVGAGVIGTSAVVATQIPVALGYAFVAKQKNAGQVVAVFLGDGAIEEGCAMESMNFAALHGLPLLFVVENNEYAIHEPLHKRRAEPDNICKMSESFGVPAVRISDGDFFSIYDAAGQAIQDMRAGKGPALIEACVYRWMQHVGPNQDFDQGYRSRVDAEPWFENDQVSKLAALISDDARSELDEEIEREIAAAVAFAEQSPTPDPEELFADVFA